MLRLRDRWVILLDTLGGELLGRTVDHHLTTDPACVRYRAPRAGSRLDRASRGHSCGRCMADGAFGRIPDYDTHCPTCDAPEPTHTPGCSVPYPRTPDHDSGSECTCPTGDGSLRWPCPVHPPTTGSHERDDVGCNICGRPIPDAEPHICFASDTSNHTNGAER